MRRSKGFTLVELLVVVAIIALLVSILLPSLQKARELTKRTICLTNLNGTGKSLGLYLTAYNDNYPFMDNRLAAQGLNYETGYNKDKEPDRENPDYRSITSLMFFFVREGNDPALFVCPSDAGVTKDPSTRDPDTGEYFWDFTGYEYVSYSIQAVATIQGIGKIPFKNPKQFYMADKNPNWNNQHPGLTAWDDDMTQAEIKNNMPPNHQHEMFNAMKGDGHADPYKRADVNDLVVWENKARPHDVIYTTFANEPVNRRTSTTTTPWVTWEDEDDAFLFGPLTISP